MSKPLDYQPGTPAETFVAGSDHDDKEQQHPASLPSYPPHTDDAGAMPATSAGVERIKLISQSLTPALRALLFFSIFLVCYSYGLDSAVRSTYQAEATASYASHSLLSTVNVLRSIIAAAAQPPLARVSDTFGRVSLVFISILFWCLGTIVEACSDRVEKFAAGAVLYQFGFTSMIVLLEVLVADASTLRNRVFVTFLLPLPFVINTWVGGDVASSTLSTTTWQWGIGMWAIIFPAACLPLIAVLTLARRRAQRNTHFNSIKPVWRQRGFAGKLFWELDIVGLFLLTAFLILILLPFTLAGGVAKSWHSAKIIVMIVLGFLLAPVFFVWEARYARHPIFPAHMLKNRTVLACFGIACLLNFSWYLQGDYLYTVLIVAFGESIKSATRIATLYSFTSALVGLAVGFIVRYVRRVKIFIIAGVITYLVAWGLLIRFRGGSADYAGIVAGQVILGLAGGLFPYQAQALIQACSSHENLAIITSLFLTSYSIGSALGNTVSGAIWTQVLPQKLAYQLGNATLAAEVYGDPFTFASLNPMGTPDREMVVVAYQQTQRLLCITGLCLSVPLVACAFLVDDIYMGDGQNVAEPDEREKNEAT